MLADFSYSFISSAGINFGWSSHFQNKLNKSNITIGIRVLKYDVTFGGKIIYIIGKCKTNSKALIIPNINYFSPAPKIFSKSPNKKIYLKPVFALSAELKNVYMALVSAI